MTAYALKGKQSAKGVLFTSHQGTATLNVIGSLLIDIHSTTVLS